MSILFCKLRWIYFRDVPGANPFGTAPSANPFGEAPPSSQQQAPGPGGIPKPRLPSVVSNDSDENDHSSSDDDDDDGDF